MMEVEEAVCRASTVPGSGGQNASDDGGGVLIPLGGFKGSRSAETALVGEIRGKVFLPGGQRRAYGLPGASAEALEGQGNKRTSNMKKETGDNGKRHDTDRK
ncbi:MAG: hypothetical protein V2A58_12020 [Planctomycetota bacterium]